MYYRNLSHTEITELKDDYNKIFAPYLHNTTDKDGNEVRQLESQWTDWKNKYDPRHTITETAEELLTMDYRKLVDVYVRFQNLKIALKEPGKDERNHILKELDEIFKYTKCYDRMIADFFWRRSDMLKIHTCYYCDMAYINVYSCQNEDGKLKKMRQFDLDHYLPKALCPCLALSLFNFVPSCQVCNSRIKGDRLPTVDSEELKVLSPTSDSNDFSHNMAIRLRTRPSVMESSFDRYIYFRTNPPYEKHVRFFHLDERYEFHKAEAMRLKRLKDRYPDSCIKKIASLLHRREASVKEDIFQMKYLKREGRCFQKLTEDILNNTKLLVP